MVIKRIEPLSFARIGGTLYAVLGLIFGCVLSVIAIAGGFAGDSSPIPGFSAMLGVGAIFILPVLYGGIGFIATLIGAAIYNAVAGMVGGIELEVQ